MSTELLDLEVPTRAANDNSAHIASTGYVDAAIGTAAATSATEFSGTKTQTTVAATNVATITLANGAVDGAAGTFTITTANTTGTQAHATIKATFRDYTAPCAERAEQFDDDFHPSILSGERHAWTV
jgi:hypothetical protein